MKKVYLFYLIAFVSIQLFSLISFNSIYCQKTPGPGTFVVSNETDMMNFYLSFYLEKDKYEQIKNMIRLKVGKEKKFGYGGDFVYGVGYWSNLSDGAYCSIKIIEDGNCYELGYVWVPETAKLYLYEDSFLLKYTSNGELIREEEDYYFEYTGGCSMY